MLAFDGAFFFRNLTNTKISRLFFSEVCIMELAYDRTHSEIIYLLTNEQKYHQFFPNSRNFFHLCVFNMDQKKILKIFTIFRFFSVLSLIKVVKKKSGKKHEFIKFSVFPLCLERKTPLIQMITMMILKN